MPPARPTAPTSLKIAHATVTVSTDNEQCTAVGSDGHFLPGSRKIVYRTDLHPDRLREVLLHEALHGCTETSGNTELFKDDDTEEAIVHAITGPLLTLIRENHDFIRFLQAG